MSRYCSYQYHCHHQFPQTDIMMRNLSLIHNRNQYLNLNLYQWGSGFSPLNPSSSLIYFMACSRSRLFFNVWILWICWWKICYLLTVLDHLICSFYLRVLKWVFCATEFSWCGRYCAILLWWRGELWWTWIFS